MEVEEEGVSEAIEEKWDGGDGEEVEDVVLLSVSGREEERQCRVVSKRFKKLSVTTYLDFKEVLLYLSRKSRAQRELHAVHFRTVQVGSLNLALSTRRIAKQGGSSRLSVSLVAEPYEALVIRPVLFLHQRKLSQHLGTHPTPTPRRRQGGRPRLCHVVIRRFTWHSASISESQHTGQPSTPLDLAAGPPPQLQPLPLPHRNQ